MADLDKNGTLDVAVAGSDFSVTHGKISVMLNQVCLDSDNDGFGDPEHAENDCPDDNCPSIYNPGQHN